MRQPTRLLLAVLATGLLALTGCSGDDKNVCGNGLKEGAEQCDDGNLTVGDGCSNTCSVETEVQACGNGVRDVEEACDDGNVQDGDGCESSCSLTPKPITQCASLPAVPSGSTCAVTKAGTSGARLFQGVVLKDSGVLNGGQVLVDAQGIIQCSECDCSSKEGAAEATVISCPQGVISPGLINAHDHITFQGPPGAGSAERYEHRHDWRRGNDGHTQVRNNGSTNILITWGELRQVMAGTTSVAGSGGQPGLLRNLDKDSVTTSGGNQQGLDEPALLYQTFPLGDSGAGELTNSCAYPGIDSPSVIPQHSAYFPHVGEGIEESAHNEFRCTSTTANGGRDLFQRQTAVIHGIAVTAKEIGTMASKGTDLIWSPRSNLSLYGDTAMVPAYKTMGVTIALGTDWVQSGSMNVLRELQCADYLNATYYARTFTDEQLWRMVTASAADITATQEKLGRLEPGKVADLAIFRLRTFAASPYRAVITANSEDVVLTMRGGKPLYGDQALVATLGQGGCESVEVCGAPKVLCVNDEMGQTFTALQTANASAYPLFFCNQAPKDEPTCVPQRTSTNASFPASVNQSTAYNGARSADDKDGDGVADAQDNCPIFFNPIRPMDNGAQADADKDGVGDVCDPCPLLAGASSCSVPPLEDEDGDSIKDWQDNCPYVANADQADADADKRGDACDACATANPGAKACAVSIYEVKKPVDGVYRLVNEPVSLADVLVTAVGSNGFFIQSHPSETGRYQGPDYSGMFVYTGAVPSVAVGDRITITAAKVADFFGQIELTDPSITKNSGGNPLPALVTVSPADVRTGGPRAAALEGVLVELNNVYVTKQEPSLGAADRAPSNEIVVDTAPGTDGEAVGVRVNDYFYVASTLPAVGTKFRLVRGVLDYRNGNSKVEPRSAQDFVSPPAALTSFGPSGQYVRVGQTGTDAFPQALTVTMAAPYFEDVAVTVESSSAALRAGDNGTVIIPVGKTSAVVPLHPLEQATSVTLTARLEDSSQTTTVRVLGEMEEPTVVSVTPTPVVTAAGHSVRFTVKLDRPAPANSTLDVTVSPATLGTVDAPALAVPLNATEATFTLTADAGTTDTGGTVTAALGTGNTASATVTLTTDPLPKLISMTPASALTVEPGATQQFTLTLDLPALYDTAIAVTAAPDTAGTTFGSAPTVVVIPTGATSAPFSFAAGSRNNVSGSVTASFDGATFTTPVTVIAAPPVLTSLTPGSARVTVGRTRVFTATVDRAVPEGGISVAVSLDSASLGSLSPTGTLTIPQGALSGQVTFTAGSEERTGQLSASWNGVTLRSDISVTLASIASHLVISEVAVQGPGGANDEFVELYNPTNQDIDITNWKLQYKSVSGATYSGNFNIATTPSTTITIKAHGYFLLAQGGYSPGAGEPAADMTYGFSMSAAVNGGGHIRIGPDLTASELNDPDTVDKLGYGTGDSAEGSAPIAGNPPASPASYERKAGPGSTAASMGSGGADETKGNGQDTDNNAADFIIRTTRQPQSSTSLVEQP
ncbi:amidohydrolase family protein [Hyalangium sp.]|uniref:amidohydrolase family protein n=1 Tax=Hyalangium sp. TaxID=2028555 RepID=UPI002D5E419A|nr:amidohydrolase family protein [Hyalangium sp.]HYI00759.1 amidohydrolase family protein [Hyalangium sp.]